MKFVHGMTYRNASKERTRMIALIRIRTPIIILNLQPLFNFPAGV